MGWNCHHYWLQLVLPQLHCDDSSDSASDRTGMLVQFDSGVRVLGWKFHESISRVPYVQSAGPCNVYRERKRSKKSWYRLPLASERHMISAKWPSNWDNWMPAIFLKWSLACIQASSISLVGKLPFPLFPGIHRLSYNCTYEGQLNHQIQDCSNRSHQSNNPKILLIQETYVWEVVMFP